MSNQPSINVTPLVDVLLVLLIMFMVTVPQRLEKLPIKAPQPAPNHHTFDAAETLMLTVSSDLQLALNTRAVTTDELIPLLAGLMQQRSAELRTLFIKAPQHVPYEAIVAVIDRAKGAGVVTIGLLAG